MPAGNTGHALPFARGWTVRAAIAAVPEDAWQPLPREDGTLSETESVARAVPVMGGTPEAFCPVVQGRAIRPAPEDPDRPVQVELAMPDREPVPVDEESALDDRYPYRAMATGPDRETMIREIAAWQNQRNADTKPVDWRFKTEDARIKPEILIPINSKKLCTRSEEIKQKKSQ